MVRRGFLNISPDQSIRDLSAEGSFRVAGGLKGNRKSENATAFVTINAVDQAL
jgi:hypothetical protein